MAIKYDFKVIARGYNQQERSYFDLPEVTEGEVKRDIREHPEKWRRLSGEISYQPQAYAQLKYWLVKRQKFQPPVRRDDPLVGHDGLRGNPEVVEGAQPGVPSWLRKEIRQVLGSLKGRDGKQSEDTLFGLLLACWAYSNQDISRMLALIRKRWRIKGDPHRLYMMLAKAQWTALEEVRHQHGLQGLTDARDYLLRGHFVFKHPWDKRVTETYRRMSYDYGLPIDDYRHDVRCLVPHLGGDPDFPQWEAWAEGLLWDFRPLPFASTELAAESAELRQVAYHFRNMVVIPGEVTSVPPAPFRDAITVNSAESHTAQSSPNGRRLVQINIHSRFVPIHQFPEQLHAKLVNAYGATWGPYKEPPSVQNMLAELEGYAKRTLTSEQVAEELWRKKASSLNRLPPKEQWREEQRAKAALRQRKSRSGRKLRL